MTVPVGLGLLAHEMLALYLTGREFTALVASGFGLALWALVSAFDLDRVNALATAIIVPWIALVGLFLALVALTAGEPPGGPTDTALRFLFPDVADLGAYAAAFTLADLAAVGSITWSRVTPWIGTGYRPHGRSRSPRWLSS